MVEPTTGVYVPPWRLRLGRWALRPYALPIWRHYERLSHPTVNPAGRRAAERCGYVAIGVQYVMNGWPHGETTSASSSPTAARGPAQEADR